MIRSLSICPLAKPEATKIVVSTLSSADDELDCARPPAGFEGIDVRLLRHEANRLLSETSDLRASTMVVHPHADALDGLTASSTAAEIAMHEGGGGGLETAARAEQRLVEAGEVAALNYARNRWLESIMPSDEVQPLAFYPFCLPPGGIDYQTMPWFSVQLIRRSELAAARDEWCRMLGMTQDEYDAFGAPNKRVARRRHLVNVAAPELFELFLDVRCGTVPCEEVADAAAWRRAARRCAERERARARAEDQAADQEQPVGQVKPLGGADDSAATCPLSAALRLMGATS